MGCKICGRGACAESFHSLEEQREHEERREMAERGECYDCTLHEQTISKLEAEKEVLADALGVLVADCDDLQRHEIDGGAHDNRWEDMRRALTEAQQILKEST